MNNQPSDPKSEPQDDFWDLDDDDLELGNAPEPQSPPKQPDLTIDQPVSEDPLGSLEDDSAEIPPSPEESVAPPEPARRRSRTKDSRQDRKPSSIIEKISILIVLGALITAAAWGIRAYLEEAPNGTLVEFKQDFPIAGDQVTIENVETWWREPVREGDDADVGVVMQARLIPCASIKVSGSGSTDIQISFRDGEGQLIGDIVNLTVSNGKFADNQSDEISVHATAGFTNPTDINPYVYEDIAPWTLHIVEGGKSKDSLVKARIEANRKEK